jgi:hypothetical protein
MNAEAEAKKEAKEVWRGMFMCVNFEERKHTSRR